MVKHDGVYWYRKDGEWKQVRKVGESPPKPSRWPVGYQRLTCATCGKYIPQGRVGRFCSDACFRIRLRRDQRTAPCPYCGRKPLRYRWGAYCSWRCTLRYQRCQEALARGE